MQTNLQCKYDNEADALYIYFNRKIKRTATKEISDYFLIDVANDNNLIGIEILNVSKLPNLGVNLGYKCSRCGQVAPELFDGLCAMCIKR